MLVVEVLSVPAVVVIPVAVEQAPQTAGEKPKKGGWWNKLIG